MIIHLLDVMKLLISNQHRHNLPTIFAKYLEICKHFSNDLVNEAGNITHLCVVPKFSDLEVIALGLTAETLSIDNENNLFNRLTGYKGSFANMKPRRQFNDRRKFTGELCETIRKRIADSIDGGEEYLWIDSKLIEVCSIAGGKRCKMGKMDYSKAPSFSYCASQGTYYYGYKLHALCSLKRGYPFL